jgi:acetyl esterase/lipase
LVVTTMLLARERGVPLPAGGMPLSPWFDHKHTGGSWDENEGNDALLSREFSQRLTAMLLGDSGDLQDPLVSPLYADLAGLPSVGRSPSARSRQGPGSACSRMSTRRRSSFASSENAACATAR